MRPFTIDVDPANSDADGLADGNSSAGATVTIDGVLASGGSFTSADGLGRRLAILDLGADDQSGATYTITGTDADGVAQTEDLAGPGASATVETTKYFLTVSSIAIASAAAGSTVDIGTVDEAASATHILNRRAEEGALIQTAVTGTVNYSVEGTVADAAGSAAPQSLDWIDITAFSGKTAAVLANANAHLSAIRLVTNSFTDTAEVQAHVSMD